jgi:integrase
VIHVRHALTLVGGKPVLSAPKTEKGKRRVSVSASVLDALGAHKKRQEAEAANLGDLWPGHDLVFTSEVGTPVHPRNLERAWYGLQKKAEVTKVRFHDLRHLNVSIRRKLGQDAKLIADQIGHTNPAFTMRLYTHLFEDDRQAAAVDLVDLFATPSKDPN